MTKARRIGRVEIATNLFSEDMNSLRVDSLKTLFSVFYPVHIAKNEYRQTAMYVGISERFDLVDEGDLIPLYHPVVTTHVIGNGIAVNYSIKFEKMEDDNEGFRFI